MRYMIDPPSGWKYGFPKALPSEAVIYYGGSDYGVKEDFNLKRWFIEGGYPEKEIDSFGEQFWCRHWIEKD